MSAENIQNTVIGTLLMENFTLEQIIDAGTKFPPFRGASASASRDIGGHPGYQLRLDQDTGALRAIAANVRPANSRSTVQPEVFKGFLTGANNPQASAQATNGIYITKASGVVVRANRISELTDVETSTLTALGLARLSSSPTVRQQNDNLANMITPDPRTQLLSRYSIEATVRACISNPQIGERYMYLSDLALNASRVARETSADSDMPPVPFSVL